MRKTAPAIVLSLLLGIAACNSGDSGDSGSGRSGSGSTERTASPTPSPPPKAALDAALLTATDLGAGWEAEAAEDVDVEDDTTATPTASETAATDRCDLDAEIGEEAQYGRQVSLSNESAGNGIEHSVEVYAAGEAASTFAEVRSSLAECEEFTSEEDELTFTVSQLTNVPTFGDESIAIKLVSEATAAGTPRIEAVIFAFRIGDVLSSVITFAQGSAPEVLATGAAQKAEVKLKALLSGGGAATPSAAAS